MRKLRVSDHAVLRWLERVEGMDVTALRRRIRRLAYNGYAHGAQAVKAENAVLIIDGWGSVTTVRTPENPGFEKSRK